jgi:dTDP-4-amino-4,6-dideoxygalactose transaminase
MKYLINKPNLSSLEKKYVNQALDTTWLSSNGDNTKIFQRKFSNFIGNKFSLAVQSGTAALHLALKALSVTDKDYVIIPNFTCVSNISAASQCNAKVILVDIEPETLGMDFLILKEILKKYKPKVLQLVHVYGFPAKDTLKILKICKQNGIKVIEDTSESLGATINGKKVGTFGDINVTSIRSEKMIGVGEGAVISTNNKILSDKISLIASRYSPFRKSSDPYWKKYFVNGEGYNYLMPHLLGSVARGQIERFKNSLLPKKIKVGKNYRSYFNLNDADFTQKELKKYLPVFWLNSIYFEKFNKDKIRKLGRQLKNLGIEVRSGFWPLNTLKCFKSLYFTKKNITKKIFEKSLILPSAYDLSIRDIKYINSTISKLIKNLK